MIAQNDIEKYCDSLNLLEAQKKRVNELFELVKKTHPDQNIEDIFMSELTQKDGKRVHLNLMFFSKSGFIECASPFEKYDIAITPYSIKGTYLRIEMENPFDISEPNECSKIIVKSPSGDPTMWGFHVSASGSNCQKLFYVVQKYIKPNYLGLSLS